MSRSAFRGCSSVPTAYKCDEGILYFVESRQRVKVPFNDALVSRTLDLLSGIKGHGRFWPNPPPHWWTAPSARDVPWWVSVFPDEVNFISANGHSFKADDVRRLAPARDDSIPVYVHSQGAVVGQVRRPVRGEAEGTGPAEGAPDGGL